MLLGVYLPPLIFHPPGGFGLGADGWVGTARVASGSLMVGPVVGEGDQVPTPLVPVPPVVSITAPEIRSVLALVLMTVPPPVLSATMAPGTLTVVLPPERVRAGDALLRFSSRRSTFA